MEASIVMGRLGLVLDHGVDVKVVMEEAKNRARSKY